MFLQDINDYSLNQAGNKSSFVIMDENDEVDEEQATQFNPYQSAKSKNSMKKNLTKKLLGKENVVLGSLPLSSIKKKTYIGDDDQSLKIKYNSASTKHSSFHNQYLSNKSQFDQP